MATLAAAGMVEAGSLQPASHTPAGCFVGNGGLTLQHVPPPPAFCLAYHPDIHTALLCACEGARIASLILYACGQCMSRVMTNPGSF
jgi:hypothetical protein